MRPLAVVAALVALSALAIGCAASTEVETGSAGGAPGGVVASTSPPPGGTTLGAGTSLVDPDRMVAVYVAGGSIARGATGDDVIAQELVVRSSIPAKFLPSTATVAPDELRGKVARFDIAPDTVIVTGMFIDPSPG